jgi:shikimate kinase
MANSTMLKPLIIGLPGSGKSTLSAALASRLGLGVIVTDQLFRKIRAIPPQSTEIESQVTRNFLERIRITENNFFDEILSDARANDGMGCSMLKDGKYFRIKYGEKIFRIFETEMLQWLYNNMRFENLIPDLSSSAPLCKENRNIFSQKNGFKVVLLNTPLEKIALNLVKDFIKFQQTKESIRGAYEMKFQEALDSTVSSSGPGKLLRKLLFDVALKETQLQSVARMPSYRSFADNVLMVSASCTVSDCVDLVIKSIRK